MDFSTVKLGDKEWFEKEQIGVKKPFPTTNLLHKDHLALRNNFRVTKEFDCTFIIQLRTKYNTNALELK